MDNILSRHRNVSILVAVLFAQVLGLAVQVKRAGASGESQDTRLIRVWTVRAVTPFEKALVWIQSSTGGLWHNYVYLRGVRAENRDLKQQIEQMRIERVRLAEDAEQARRLQLLFEFREKFISKTLVAQVVGTSGSEQSRSVYIDKGRADGVKTDQAVITANGIVGKILHVYDDHTSNVLLVNDQTSGVGVILEKSRVQGILRGAANGELAVEKIMSDEGVQPGDRVLTSGGDRIFPKGLEVGAVKKVSPGSDAFLNIRIQPSANLSKLEEVLVVTKIEERSPSPGEVAGAVRAVDVLTRRLPSVPDKPPVAAAQSTASGGNNASIAGGSGQSASPSASATKKAGATEPGVAGQSVPKQGGAAQVAGTPKALPGTLVNSTGTAKPQNLPPANSAQPGTSQTQGAAAESGAAVKNGASAPPNPNKPQEVKKVPVQSPENRASSTVEPNAKLPSGSEVKATSSTGSEIPGALKPAVVTKAATPAAKTAEQSAKPAAPQPRPVNKAPAEEKAQ